MRKRQNDKRKKIRKQRLVEEKEKGQKRVEE